MLLLTKSTADELESSCKQRSKPAVCCTVTVNEQLAPDVVLQFTVVVPLAKKEPDAGLHVTVPQSPPVVGAG